MKYLFLSVFLCLGVLGYAHCPNCCQAEAGQGIGTDGPSGSGSEHQEYVSCHHYHSCQNCYPKQTNYDPYQQPYPYQIYYPTQDYYQYYNYNSGW